MGRHDMSLHVSKVDTQFLKHFCLKYNIHPNYKPTPPKPNARVTECPDGFIALYTKVFELSNIRLPFSLFFLDFLKDYTLSIAQLSPLSVTKVINFEIACRAHGCEPSLPLFRQFFKLARYGDWYAVEKIKDPAPYCLSWMPTSSYRWKDSFFWVSADSIPFKLVWRQPDQPLNVIRPITEKFDKELYGLLVKNPVSLQTFPEHVLVMIGLSRNWPNVNSEPILKLGDEEMGLLKYIQIKGLGGVDLTTRSLAEHENNVLDRTKGVCYEGGPSRVQSDIEKPVLGPEIELDPIVVPNTEVVPKKETLIEEGGKKWPEVSASSSKKRKFVRVVSTSSENSQSHGNKDDVGVCVSDDPKLDLDGLLGSVPEFLKWHEREAKKEAQLRNRTSFYCLKMKHECAKNVKLSKKLKDLKRMSIDKGKEVAEGEEKLKQAYEELELQREVFEKLNAELELKNEIVEKLKEEKDGWMQERVSLENSLGRVSSERQWLIKEGFEYVINRLHRSGEYLGPLGAVQKKLWESGAHYGVEQGYECCKAGVALEDVSLYKSKAYEEFLKAVDELEHTRFPYVVALSQCADRTLDELKALKPVEMEEEDEAMVGGNQIM